MKNIGSKIFNYYNAHIWCRFILVFIISVLGIAFIFQTFLKHEYYLYLEEKQYLMEKAVLENAKENLSFTLKEYINMGAEIATSDKIYEETEALLKLSDYRNKINLQKSLMSDSRNSNKLVTVAIINKDGLVYQYDAYKTTTTIMWSEEDNLYLKKYYKVIKKMVENQIYPPFLIDTKPKYHPGNESLKVFHLYFPMIGKTHDIKEIHNILCLSFKMDVMNQFVESLNDSELNYLNGYITDNNNQIICHTDKKIIGMSETEYLESNSMSKLTKELGVGGFKLNIAYDEKKALAYVNNIFNQNLVIYIGLFALLSIILYIIIKWITSPISKIRNAMSKITEQNEKQKIEIKGHHEIWQLAEKYNIMLDDLDKKQKEIEYHHEQMLLSIERQHEAERAALETQINGHFLCNTLNTINYEAIEEGNYKVSTLIKKLSNILRYSFSQQSQNVYLFQEFAWIEQYLYLMKSRLEDVFEYDVKIEDKIEQWPCCKLILQPFVENAIIHGFEGVNKGGILRVLGEKRGDIAVIHIWDNGCGISEEREKIIQEILRDETIDIGTIGIGIRNVMSRMRLYYGSGLKVTLYTTFEKGTEFVFELPVPEGRSYRGGIMNENYYC